MTYIILYLEFVKVGLFTVGGGLASLPFLYELADKYTWFDKSTLADMIAISQSTPGPIGVNMATYAGFEAGGILGGLIATLGIVTPSFIIIIVIAHYISRFKESELIQSIFVGLRPAVAGLILVAWYEIIKISVLTIDKFAITKNIKDIIDIKGLIFFGVMFYITKKFNKHPIYYIAIGAIVGIIFKI